MASEIKVNTIKDLGGNTIVSSNGSGTFTSNLPSTTLTGSTNNTITTVTGANAIQGEADLTFDGDSLLVKNGASGGSGANANANELVVENSDHGGISILTPYDKTGAIYFGDGSDDNIGMIEYPHDANCLKFTTNASEGMRIDSSGNVGIGETSPLGKLHVKTADSGASVEAGADEVVVEGSANSGISILSGTSNEGSIKFGDSGDNDIGMLQYHHSNNSMQMYTSGSERIRIDSSGRVLVGDGSPIDTNANMSVYATANYPLATKVGATGNTQQIGFNNGNGHVGGITTNGTATAFNTSSDYRLKENISYDFDATARLKQLKPSRFNFKTDASKTVDGFLAHEVSNIIPEAITGSKDATETRQNIVLNANGTMIFNGVLEQDHIDGKADGSYPSDSTWIAEKEIPVYQSIDQSKLVPLLVKSLQEALAEIDTLKTKVTALENA